MERIGPLSPIEIVIGQQKATSRSVFRRESTLGCLLSALSVFVRQFH
jgi:hypothetical protein